MVPVAKQALATLRFIKTTKKKTIPENKTGFNESVRKAYRFTSAGKQFGCEKRKGNQKSFDPRKASTRTNQCRMFIKQGGKNQKR